MPKKAEAHAAPQPSELDYTPQSYLLYGDFGLGKSTMASTFDVCGPGFVAMFDGYGKARPYMRRGDEIEEDETEDGIPIRRVYLKKKLLWEIHFYHDENPEKPDAFRLYRKEIREFKPQEWANFVNDSVTSMALAAFLEQRFRINPADEGAYDDKKSLKWRGGSTDQVEFQLCRRYISYPVHGCNTIVICHTQKDKALSITKEGAQEKRVRVEVDEELVRGLAAPGRLSSANGLPSQYDNVFRAFCDTKGKDRTYWVQTKPNSDWLASNQIDDIADPCPATFEAIWDTK